MKRLLLLIGITLVLTSCSSAKKYNEQITSLHTVETLQADVDKAYTQLKRHHPNLYLYTSKEKLDYKFDSLKKRIVKPLTSYEFLR